MRLVQKQIGHVRADHSQCDILPAIVFYGRKQACKATDSYRVNTQVKVEILGSRKWPPV